MRVDLTQLLRDRPVVHPSRIVSMTLNDRELCVRVTGYPWWEDRAEKGRNGSIEFIFGDVTDGVLDPLDFEFEFDEALEIFSVSATSDLPWAQPQGSAIYCNAPLRHPTPVYLIVHDFLASQGAFRRAWQYLNCPESEQLTPFIQITQSSSYLLGRFPLAIQNLVCGELDAQGVSYSAIPIALEKPGRLLVTFQKSQFFCETAEATFE
jgi:hypothetical protein